MGRYHFTLICRGFHISARVDVLPTISKDWIIRDASGITFVCPSTIKRLKSFPSCIDNDDMSQGFVSMDKLIKFNELSPSHFEVTDEDKKRLESIRQYYQEMIPQEKEISEISNVAVEYMWTTLNPDRMNEIYLQKALLIK